MKIRYSNGFSLSLWNDEYLELIVEEDHISYLTVEGKWIKIRISSTWSQGSSSSSQYKVGENASSSSNEVLEAGVRHEQASPPSLDPPRESHNEHLTTKVEENGLQDEITKLKQDIERLLQKEPCKLYDIEPKFASIKQAFEEIKTYHNRLSRRVYDIERGLCGDFDDLVDEEDNQTQPIQLTPLNPYNISQIHDSKKPEPIFSKKTKKKK